MKKLLTLLWIEIVQTLLRMLPFPCKTGLVEIGRPGRDSPVASDLQLPPHGGTRQTRARGDRRLPAGGEQPGGERVVRGDGGPALEPRRRLRLEDERNRRTGGPPAGDPAAAGGDRHRRPVRPQEDRLEGRLGTGRSGRPSRLPAQRARSDGGDARGGVSLAATIRDGRRLGVSDLARRRPPRISILEGRGGPAREPRVGSVAPPLPGLSALSAASRRREEERRLRVLRLRAERRPPGPVALLHARPSPGTQR